MKILKKIKDEKSPDNPFLIITAVAGLTTDSFANFVLILALIVIGIIVFLVLLNVAQKIVGNYLERREQEMREEAATRIRLFLQAPNQPDHREALRSYLNHIDIIEMASEALSEVEQDKLRQLFIEIGAGHLLEQQARQARRKWQRVQALLLLGWLGSAENILVLKEALNDEDSDIGYAAAEALSRYNSEIAYRMLIDTLNDENLSRSRLAAFIESSRFKNVVPLLIDRADNSKPAVRFWIAYLLGRTHDPSALTLLSKMADDDSADVRASACEALGELGSKKASPVLQRKLRDSDWPVRSHVAKSIGKIGDDELIPDLLPLLHDPHWWVRQNVTLTLERFGKKSVPYLKELLRDRDRFTRNKAAELLGRLGIISAEISKLSGTESEAGAAHDFLVVVGQAEALRIIEDEALSSTNATIQSRLAAILGEIGSQRSLPVLEELHHSNISTVRRSANQAIERIRGAA